MPLIEVKDTVWIVELPKKNIYTVSQVRIIIDLAQLCINKMYNQIEKNIFVLPLDDPTVDMNVIRMNVQSMFGEIQYVEHIESTEGE